MAEQEIPVRIRRTAYDSLRGSGAKSIKDRIDELIECSKTHVVQTVVGRVLTGNAGLTKKHIKIFFVTSELLLSLSFMVSFTL